MNPQWNFGLVNPEHLYGSICGRGLRPGEGDWLSKYANRLKPSESSLYLSAPFDCHKKTLVVYACCHGAQLVDYWNRFYPDRNLGDRFNVAWINNYAWRRDGRTSPHLVDNCGWLLMDLIRRADYFIWHPGYAGTEFDPRHMRRSWCPSARSIPFHSPSFEALWGISEYFGERPVAEAVARGLDMRACAAAWLSGILKTHLVDRFDAAVERLHNKDRDVDVGISDFFEDHCTDRRLFLTTNHPNTPLIGCLGQRIMRIVLNSAFEDCRHSLELPDNAIGLDEWPDCGYAHRDLGLRYPLNVPAVFLEGRRDEHYLGVIRRIYDRFESRYSHSTL
jgi:hypothetical protein